MDNFRNFIESNESDARESIRKLPASHRNLVRGFKLAFDPNGTIKSDDDHIGKVENTPKKKITVAAPWYYPREFALLHEIGHLVWAKYVKGTPLENKWMTIYKNTKGKVKQNAEECFCHNYSQFYSYNKMLKFNHGEPWVAFIRNLPK